MTHAYQPYLIAGFSQALLYGLYVTTFVHCIRWLVFEDEGWKFRSHKEVNWFVLIIAILVFVLATTDLVLSLILTMGELGKGKLVGDHLLVVNSAIEGFSFLIIDAVLIFRCWIVYEKSRRVILLPLLLWLSAVTGTIFLTVSDAMFLLLPASRSPVVHPLTPSWNICWGAFSCCVFITNVYATSAIVYRVYRVARASNSRSSALYEVCRAVAGTGALYTSTSAALIITLFVGMQDGSPYLICAAINFPMSSVTFNLLIVRIGQLRASPETGASESQSSAPVLSTVLLQGSSTTSGKNSFNQLDLHRSEGVV